MEYRVLGAVCEGGERLTRALGGSGEGGTLSERVLMGIESTGRGEDKRDGCIRLGARDCCCEV